MTIKTHIRIVLGLAAVACLLALVINSARASVVWVPPGTVAIGITPTVPPSPTAVNTPTPIPTPTVVSPTAATLRCGVLYANASAATTTGATLQHLYTYTVPGGTLANAGDYLRIRASAIKANSSSAQSSAITLGGTTLSSNAVTTANTVLIFEDRVVYQDAATVATNELVTAGGSLFLVNASRAFTMASDQVVNLDLTTSGGAGGMTWNDFEVYACTH